MDLFFELLQVGLGTRSGLSKIPTESQWRKFFETAHKQTLVGVCFTGMEKLPVEYLPETDERLRWITRIHQIEHWNYILNNSSVEVLQKFSEDGFRGCILKGQGNALMYPKPERRQPGDVDIWLVPDKCFTPDGRRKEHSAVKFFRSSRSEIIRYVTKKYPEVKVQLHHVDYPSAGKVEVEVHFFPIYLKNPVHHRRLLRFFSENIEEQFNHKVTISGGAELTVPTASFNAVFQLVHVYLHYLFQGVGLRHVVDYYYVLSQLTDEREKQKIIAVLKSLGMMKFAGAMMWVLHTICGMPYEELLCRPDEKEGRRLLTEMMGMGNFGKYDELYWKNARSGIRYGIQKLRRSLRFAFTYPQEIFWDPYFRFRLFLAKKFNV